jgi:hypothetical protein
MNIVRSDNEYYSYIRNVIESGSVDELQQAWDGASERGEIGLVARSVMRDRIFLIADRFRVKPCDFSFQDLIQAAEKKMFYNLLADRASANATLNELAKSADPKMQQKMGWLLPFITKEELKFYNIKEFAKALYLILLDGKKEGRSKSTKTAVSRIIENAKLYLSLPDGAGAMTNISNEDIQSVIADQFAFFAAIRVEDEFIPVLADALPREAKRRFQEKLLSYPGRQSTQAQTSARTTTTTTSTTPVERSRRDSRSVSRSRRDSRSVSPRGSYSNGEDREDESSYEER